MGVMSQDAAFHQGVPQLQTLSADIYSLLSKNAVSLEDNFIFFQSYLIHGSYVCIRVFSVLLWFLVLMFTLDFSLVLSFIHSVTA
jgi:hypothetical protein